MSKCYVNVCGGVGNQLFQVAAGFSYSRTHHRQLFIDTSHWTASQGTNPLVYKDTIFKNFEYAVGENTVDISEKSSRYDKIPSNKGEVSLTGYFQSLKYFQNHAVEFYEMLSLPKVRTDFIGEKNVAFHIRRGDYLYYPDIFDIGNAYFHRQFISFKDYQINVFTDSPEIVLAEFKGYDFNLVQTSSELNDLTLISLHDNVVCSNSSFSWWASFLGKMKTKIIVPDRWIKGQDCSDIYRPEMIIEITQ